MNSSLPVVVFTDVDGILYDPHARSFDHVGTLLDRLEQREAPLVLCSQKSHVELERVRYLLGIDDPFIAEHGAAVFVPDGYFGEGLPAAHEVGGYRVVEPVRSKVATRDDIGCAVEWLCARYRRAFGPLLTIGLGRVAEHLPLLCSVDVPVIVQHENPQVTSGLLAALPGARVTTLNGSSGWAAVVLDILASMPR
jgi:predicted mannosyl-3-phosphoglycerate phosphatase (HAD superfamily)